ncbi:thiol peroxidase [Fructilactobacillus florum]|uniref:Thioredoxin domain-containing protein n=1 Tax=Fructilactobacillus florum DSM 22689 = JCM 16035 TaxID=1423745 RepID=A0A0R2CMX5_9LACO|nr:peroxiredoxin [Fructilactobacillus florum]KRM92528.1 hypothetical protein FC87_GL000140 [Fructilactobacillus florum DSM 22689 = JCM 16035]
MTIKLGGIPIQWLMGNQQPQVGEELPNFTLRDQAGKQLTTTDLIGKPLLLSVVPDLRTKVCSLETAQFNQTASQFRDVRFVTVSNNPVKYQKNWCAAHDVTQMEIMSDAEGSFGKATHLYIPIFRHLARAVYLVDATGKITFCQMVSEISHQPDYQPVIKALQQLLTNPK